MVITTTSRLGAWGLILAFFSLEQKPNLDFMAKQIAKEAMFMNSFFLRTIAD